MKRKIAPLGLGLAVVAAVLVWAIPAGAHRTGAKAKVITVTAGKPGEFGFALSTKSVPHGTVTFQVKNAGKLVHDFSIAGKKTAELGAGASAKLTVTFAKAGSYPFECTVTGHAAAGMKGTLKVT